MYQYSIKLNDKRIPMLVQEKALPGRREKLNSPKVITEFMNNVFDLEHQAEEYGYLLCMDQKCHINAIMNVSHGAVNQTILSPREIFVRSLLSGAANIVVIHNHPSGDVSPSEEDIKVTKRIKKAGELIGVTLLDHIVVGMNGDYYSFANEGNL